MAIPSDSERTNSDRMRLNISVNEARRPEPRPEPFRLQSSPEVDPFRDRETREKKPDREIHFSIKPWKLLKFFLVLVLLSGLFFTGRWSATGTEGMFGFSASAPTAAVVTEKASSPPLAVEKAAEPAVKEKVAAPVVAPPADAAKEDTTEEVITKYSKVALATSSVKLEWHETWGKIMQLVLTIKNNEAGTIKPSYLIMNVEGYDDFDKKIELPKTIQLIKAGEKIEGSVNVPNGFAYNKITTGDLATVKVLVKMYDEKDVVITSYEREFNLDGSAQ